MFQQEYNEICRELKAPANKIEEVIEMTENKPVKHRRPLKIAIGLVAVFALMMIAVSAASPELLSKAVSFIVLGGEAGDTVLVHVGDASVGEVGTYKYSTVDGSQGELQLQDGDQVIKYHVVDGSEEWDEFTSGKIIDSGTLQSNP